MTYTHETDEQRLNRLHEELARLYRAGVSNEDPRIDSYWARIDKLEDHLLRVRTYATLTQTTSEAGYVLTNILNIVETNPDKAVRS